MEETKMEKSADQVLREKYEERGWDQDTWEQSQNTNRESIDPVPLSEEEYQLFQLLLGKVAVSDRNPNLCEIYFDMQRRAVYGNGYAQNDRMEEVERELWEIGMETSDITRETPIRK